MGVGKIDVHDSLVKTKPVPGYEGVYSIREDGAVISLKHGRQLKPQPNSMGYLRLHSKHNKKRVSLFIHRILAQVFLGADKEARIDHIDHNPRNNSLSNLRTCTQSQNLQNARLRCDNKTGCKGIYFNKRNRNWCAEIKTGYRRIWLGVFPTKELAVEARRNGESLYHGEFACSGK